VTAGSWTERPGVVREMANSVLVIGYGNPGRQDDGLGPALAEAVEQLRLPGVTVEADYQLTVEDAAAAAAHRYVVFADASVGGREPFFFRAVHPAAPTSFSTHSLEPEAVLALARDLFQADTRGYALGIRGYRFNEFGETLSDEARENLAAALRFIVPVLEECTFEAAASADEGVESPAHLRICP
jgi:hydrogenase maturation protease